MKVLLILALAVLAHSEEIKKDRGVLVLEKDTFKAAVTDNKHVLVEFCEYKTLCLNLYRRCQPI